MSTTAPAEASNAFIGTTTPPSETDLQQALGPAKNAWDNLLDDLAAKHNATIHEWKSYSAKSGWALRVLRGKRTIVWLAPYQDCFRAAFILGDKAMKAAREQRLSARATRALSGGQKYPEGTGVRVLVSNPKDLTAVKELAAIKVAN